MMGDLGDTMKPVLVIDAKATEHILHSQTDALEALEPWVHTPSQTTKKNA